MSNLQNERYSSPKQNSAYSRPSVPISVYRELAAELQTAQAMLESLNNQNKQLVKQNKQLRQEVEKVVQSAQHLQQVITSLEPVTGVEKPKSKQVRPPEEHYVPPNPPPRPAATVPSAEFISPSPKPEPTQPQYREQYVIEQEENHYHHSRRDVSPGVNGWLLVVAILGVVLTAFGTGFLIVRPLINNNR
ncbi:MAG: hypothetical protein WA919_17815 [Coleofasciculaceae cyanobacterium]